MNHWRIFFLISGLFSIVGGILGCFLFERQLVESGLPEPFYGHAFQLLFLTVAIFGVGYLMVWRDPVANRNIVWLGLATKVAGFFITLYALDIGELPAQNALQPWIVDLPWAIAFGLFLFQTRRARTGSKTT